VYSTRLRCVRPKATLVLTETERDELLALARRRKTEQAAALRARIVLAWADEVENNSVAEQLSVTKQTVSKWRGRFVKHRLDELLDAPRSVLRARSTTNASRQ
jgi:hypothetical protein